jgi:hypothetical protein
MKPDGNLCLVSHGHQGSVETGTTCQGQIRERSVGVQILPIGRHEHADKRPDGRLRQRGRLLQLPLHSTGMEQAGRTGVIEQTFAALTSGSVYLVAYF